MERITSVQNNKVKEWYKLQQKKYRDETGLFIIEEEHLIEEANKLEINKNELLEMIKEYKGGN